MDKISDSLVYECIQIFNNEENKRKIKDYVIDPILNYISGKAYPYFITLIVLLIINIIFLGVIIYYK